MDKKIIFLIIIIVIIAALLFNPYSRLLFSAVVCGISPNCGVSGGENWQSIREEAIESKNIEACDNLPKEAWFSTNNPRGYCYLKYALENKDVDVCFKMKEFKLSSDAAINIEGITVFGSPVDCYIGVAQLTGDQAMCENILEIDPSLKDTEDSRNLNYYISRCYGGIAKKLQDKQAVP